MGYRIKEGRFAHLIVTGIDDNRNLCSHDELSVLGGVHVHYSYLAWINNVFWPSGASY